MEKKIIATVVTVSLIILILGIVLVYSWERNNKIKLEKVKAPSTSELIYYYGQTCPHCQDVKKWMDENKVREKIKIEEKEVWYNQDNALELRKAAEACRLDTNNIGVPFLWAEGKCYIGTPQVIKILEEKIKNATSKQQK